MEKSLLLTLAFLLIPPDKFKNYKLNTSYLNHFASTGLVVSTDGYARTTYSIYKSNSSRLNLYNNGMLPSLTLVTRNSDGCLYKATYSNGTTFYFSIS